MTTVTATLEFALEWEEEDIESDPSELLLEILADCSDNYLLELIKVTRS
jgi:hypothetical protein